MDEDGELKMYKIRSYVLLLLTKGTIYFLAIQNYCLTQSLSFALKDILWRSISQKNGPRSACSLRSKCRLIWAYKCMNL